MPSDFPKLAQLAKDKDAIQAEVERLRAELTGVEPDLVLRLGSLIYAADFYSHLPEEFQRRVGVEDDQATKPSQAFDPGKLEATLAQILEVVQTTQTNEALPAILETLLEGQTETNRLLGQYGQQVDGLQAEFLDNNERDKALDLTCDMLGELFNDLLNDEVRRFANRGKKAWRPQPWMLETTKRLLERFELVKHTFPEQRRRHLQYKADQVQQLLEAETPSPQAEETQEAEVIVGGALEVVLNGVEEILTQELADDEEEACLSPQLRALRDQLRALEKEEEEKKKAARSRRQKAGDE